MDMTTMITERIENRTGLQGQTARQYSDGTQTLRQYSNSQTELSQTLRQFSNTQKVLKLRKNYTDSNCNLSSISASLSACSKG